MNGCARLIVTVTGRYMPVIVAEEVPGYVVCLETMYGITHVSVAQVTVIVGRIPVVLVCWSPRTCVCVRMRVAKRV